MISTVLRRSFLGASRRSQTLSASLTSINAALFHSLTPSSAAAAVVTVSDLAGNGFTTNVKLSDSSNTFGVIARAFHAKSAPSEFRSSIVSSAGFAAHDYAAASYEDNDGGDEESVATSDGGDGLAISELGISPEIVKALSGRGIEKLFPIQKAVLEPAMEGRDMIGRARTGTGKTLAFGIPVIDKIIKFNAKHGRGKNPLCLVLAPTRELARQVEKEFRESAPSLDTICLYGGTPIGQQMRELGYGVDVAVGTPGRVIDLMKRGVLNLSEVQFVVLDEADQMLQVGFAEDVEIILQKLPEKRQSMMFSATMPSWIRSLTKKYLNNPLTIDLVGDSDQKLADGITMYSIAADSYGKASIIGPLIAEHGKGGKCIVFTQTKRDADRLAYGLAKSFKCEALHGDISQHQRERTLAGFRDGNFNVLVATEHRDVLLQKEAEESTSKIKGTKICIAIRSFDNPEKQAWCLPPHTRKIAMPDTRVLYTVLRSPHVDKKSREQFEMRFKKRLLVIKAQSHELSKKLFWLKRYRILGAQYELQFHCKTRLDMNPVLDNIHGVSTIGQ